MPLADYLTGKTPDEVNKLATDDDGKPKDADLLSGCTIAVDGYRDAVVRGLRASAKAAGLGPRRPCCRWAWRCVTTLRI